MASTSTKPEIVLVPGAWHFPHHFELLRNRLHSLGYKTHTVALVSASKEAPPPMADHQPDVAAIHSTIQPLAEAGTKMVVFVHSYGGVPTADALKGLITTKDDNSKGGVFHVVACNAIVLQPEESLFSAVQRAGVPETWFDVDEQGIATVHADKGARVFYQPGVDDKTAQDAFSQAGLHAAATFMSPVSYNAWKDVPLTYISSSEDACVTPKCQELMLESIPGVNVVKMEGGHAPFLAHPDFVAGVIQKVA